MDFDALTKLLQSDTVVYAEVTTYHMDGNKVVRRQTKIDYSGDDYDWSSTTKPLVVLNRTGIGLE